MALHGHVFTAPDGVRGFDTAERVSDKAATAFLAHGYRFAVRYVRRAKAHAGDLGAEEASALLDAGLALMAGSSTLDSAVASSVRYGCGDVSAFAAVNG